MINLISVRTRIQLEKNVSYQWTECCICIRIIQGLLDLLFTRTGWTIRSYFTNKDNNAFPNSTWWISGPHLHSILISEVSSRHRYDTLSKEMLWRCFNFCIDKIFSTRHHNVQQVMHVLKDNSLNGHFPLKSNSKIKTKLGNLNY